MENPKWLERADRRILAELLADRIADSLRSAIHSRGVASLVVSGGSTPLPLFRALSGRPLSWGAVWVTLADERWVPIDDAASNEALVRRELLIGDAADARWVGLYTGDETPEAGVREAQRRLAEIPRPFDVVVLGMGGDGHTASLFPGAPELAAALAPSSRRSCLALRPPGVPQARMSLSLAALLKSREIVLHMTGKDKREVYEKALGDGLEVELPIRAVLRRAGDRLTAAWAP